MSAYLPASMITRGIAKGKIADDRRKTPSCLANAAEPKTCNPPDRSRLCVQARCRHLPKPYVSRSSTPNYRARGPVFVARYP
jgi:hypothetical protein